MWSAFITGMATEANKMIDERDKEIRDLTANQMNSYYKRALEAKKKAETRREQIKDYAGSLGSFQLPDGTKLTETQIVGLIESGQAKEVIDLFQTAAKEGRLSKEQFEKVIKPEPGEKKDITSFIQKKATPAATAAGLSFEEQAKQTRGAFGLPSGREVSRIQQEFLAKSGMTEEEIRATELPEMEVKGRAIDYGVFAKPRTFAQRKERAQSDVLSATTDEDRKKALAELTTILKIEDLGKKEGPTESDIRSNFRILTNTIAQSMAGPGDLVIDKETGTYMYSKTIKPEVRAKIEQAKLDGFKDLVREYQNPDGTVPDNVRRVLIANGVKFDRNGVPVFTVTQSGGSSAPSAPAPAQTPAAPSARPASARNTSGLPRPTTQAEYNAIPPNTDYIDTDGIRKTKTGAR